MSAACKSRRHFEFEANFKEEIYLTARGNPMCIFVLCFVKLSPKLKKKEIKNKSQQNQLPRELSDALSNTRSTFTRLNI